MEEAEPVGEPELQQKEIPTKKAPPIKSKPSEENEIMAVVELLKHLKGLAGALPEKEKASFKEGKLPTNLESVIDSLQNLTIIKE
jgi:hypothetical protein